ncbi:aerolysin family beta-barrel pore-forming toxin [Actinomycetes bacterium KLBMP 9759]
MNLAIPNFFVHSDFRGKPVPLDVGEYDLWYKPNPDLPNDSLSSLIVPEGYQVVLYEDAEYKGRDLVCTADIRDLADLGFDNIVSSIKVSKTAGPPTVYADKNFTGTKVTLPPGRYPNSGSFAPLGNDASSVKVPPGYEIALYQDAGFGGGRRTFDADVADLSKHGFDNTASSIVVWRGPRPSLVTLDAGTADERFSVKDARGTDDLMRRIANDPTVIANLANVAQALGFGWCGGSDLNVIGKGFDIERKGAGTYTLTARGYSGDPAYKEPRPGKRLIITLSDFRLLIDPTTIKFGPALLEQLQPAAIITKTAENRSELDDTATVNFDYQLINTTAHTFGWKITEGIKVSTSFKFKTDVFPAKVEVTTGLEVSFASEQAWSDTTTESTSDTLKHSYEAKVPGRSRRAITLYATRNRAEVAYTADAVVSFSIQFDGFLRWEGNARADHPTDRPDCTVKFGDAQTSGAEQILDQYHNRHVPGYSQWDWEWAAAAKDGPGLASALTWLNKTIHAPVSGRFGGVRQTTVSTVVQAPVSLDKIVTDAPPPTGRWAKVELPTGVKALDITIGADGLAWVLSTATTGPNIYRLVPGRSTWDAIPEYRAAAIAAGEAGALWIVNAGGGVTANAVYPLSSPPPTSPPYPASDIAMGLANTVFVIARRDDGTSIVLRHNGPLWTSIGPPATAIAVGPHGIPWICDTKGNVLALHEGVWKAQSTEPMTQLDWSAAPVPVLWAADAAKAVRRWTGSQWQPAPAGVATRIAVHPDSMPWRIDESGDVYKLVSS